MSFVSLCFTNNQIYGKVPSDTFEDIKLTELFEKNVLSVMEKLPTEEDIFLRHEVFCSLEDEKTRNFYFSCLYELQELKRIFSAYSKAKSEKEKVYIFSSLLYGVCNFYKKAAQRYSNSGFLKAFSDQFEKLINKESFKNAAKDSAEIKEKIFGEFSVVKYADRIAVAAKTKEGFLERIKKCAEDMEISLGKCDYLSRRISPEFTNILSEIYPDIWPCLDTLYEKYKDIPNQELLEYIDQLDFYLSVFTVMQRVKGMGIPLCFAVISQKESIRIYEGYDITLVSKECENIIPNDIIFDKNDPFFFLSGANGGGKTTYLRTCGVNVLFSLLGCPVCAKSSSVCMLNGVLTHFPRDERFDSDGRFLDEQKRVETMLSDMGKRSLLLLNETYSTTNEAKAAQMTASLAHKLFEEKQFGVYVTHQKSVLKESIPLLGCKVDTDDENKRTFKIERINYIGSSFAEDILKKYALSRADLEERFGEL
ncbi:MAG: hypothetical protein IKU52_07650 [Clostridia bacterium]|nr:hypothetical protein [Clostridia bacterium]